MPILRRRVDGGYILRGFVRAARGFCTWQLSSDGVRCLKEKEVRPGDRVRSELFQSLLDRGFAFTGKSGVMEADIAPEWLEDSARPTPEGPDLNEIDPESTKLLNRWLPRLADRAPEVREQAAIHLGKLAVHSPPCRERLVVVLLDFAVEEECWWVIGNGLFFSGEFGVLPKLDAKWLGPFVDAYLELGAVPDSKQSLAWRELETLVVERHLAPNTPLFSKVIGLARKSLNGAQDDARSHLFAIIDWAEDNA